MAVTRLSPGGYPRPPYGSFSGKPAAASGSKTFTRMFTVHGMSGYSRPPWASFAGKVAPPPANPNAPLLLNGGSQYTASYWKGRS